MGIPPRPEVLAFTPYSPGLSIDEIQDRYGLSLVIKLASNENPLGASPLVQAALKQHAAKVFRYPQSGNPRLTKALAEFFKAPAESIVTGNGSDEVIDLILRAVAVPGQDNVVASRPCFSLYELQSRLCGVEFRQAPLNEDFSPNLPALKALVDEHTKVVFLTTPDNPSGYLTPRAEILALLDWLPATCLLALDEAYIDFAGEGPEEAFSLLGEAARRPNLAVLRTFSKSFGLAGLRLGFGALAPELADYLRRIRPPFSVNILAEEAGLAALADTDFRAASLYAVRQGRAFLHKALEETGCTPWPSAANFLIFRLPQAFAAGRAEGGAPEVFTRLLERGIIIRRLGSYRLPEYLRVSVGNEEENRAFIQALREILHG